MNSMKYRRIVFFICIFGLYANQAVRAEEKKFLIPPFENFSLCKARTEYEVTFNDSRYPTHTIKKSFQIDQYSEAGRSLLEDRMKDMNAKIIERRRIDQILSESKLTHRNGYVNKEGAVEMGVLAGADTLIMGTILNIHNKVEVARSYNLNEQIKKTICSIRIRIIDIKSGNVLFSKRAKGEAISTSSNYGEKIDSDSAYTALERSIDNLFDIESFTQRIQKYVQR
ncbi:MAG: hypothetical protein D3911_11350 [Candidatus Electrothrix sp. AW3_4]|nr:hypothetical protein [Candidatus Electrothrix gigas]